MREVLIVHQSCAQNPYSWISWGLMGRVRRCQDSGSGAAHSELQKPVGYVTEAPSIFTITLWCDD